MTEPFVVTRRIGADHPAFAGHFPGRPVLPGVSLLAELLEVVAADATLSRLVGAAPRLSVAKFAAAVGPGSTITIRLVPGDTGIDFTVHDDSATLAASGRFAHVTLAPDEVAP